MSGSVVPTFASFPYLDVGPSNDPAKVSRTSKSRKDGKKRSKKGDEHKKKRTRHHRVESDPLNDFDGEKRPNLIDERQKAEEDRIYRNEDATIGGDGALPLFYSDRRGDSLNVRFGGLHAGDVPKHFLVDRE
jgi:hypothetical protein